MIRLLPAAMLLALAPPADAAQRRRDAVPAPAMPQVEDGLPLLRLPQQALPEQGCALFLWSAGPAPKLVLMGRGDMPVARVALASGVVDLSRAGADGVVVGGIPARSRFSDGQVTVAWDIEVEQRADVANGALVPSGTLSFTPAAGDAVAMAVTGIIGCQG